MHLESTPVNLAKSQEETFTFLRDPKNFETIMPSSLEKFEVLDDKTFKFALKGMPEIVLERKSETPHSEIVLGAAGGKLPFQLKADIQDDGAGASIVVLDFKGEFNAMMAMMIKGPITQFLKSLTENLSKLQ